MFFFLSPVKEKQEFIGDALKRNVKTLSSMQFERLRKKTQNEAEDGLVDKGSICVLVTEQRATKAPPVVGH